MRSDPLPRLSRSETYFFFFFLHLPSPLLHLELRVLFINIIILKVIELESQRNRGMWRKSTSFIYSTTTPKTFGVPYSVAVVLEIRERTTVCRRVGATPSTFGIRSIGRAVGRKTGHSLPLEETVKLRGHSPRVLVVPSSWSQPLDGYPWRTRRRTRTLLWCGTSDVTTGTRTCALKGWSYRKGFGPSTDLWKWRLSFSG